MKNVNQVIKGLLCVGMLLLSNYSFGQQRGFHYGGRLGLGESYLDIYNETGEKGLLAASGGIASTYQFNRFFGLTADFLVTRKGARMIGEYRGYDIFGIERDYSYTDRYNLVYAELPFTAKASIPITSSLAFKIFAGPSINFKLMGWQTREYDDALYNEEYGYSRELNDLNTTDYTMTLGGGLEVYSNTGKMFFIDVRYSDPMGSLGRINENRTEGNYILLSAGYMF